MRHRDGLSHLQDAKQIPGLKPCLSAEWWRLHLPCNQTSGLSSICIFRSISLLSKNAEMKGLYERVCSHFIQVWLIPTYQVSPFRVTSRPPAQKFGEAGWDFVRSVG